MEKFLPLFVPEVRKEQFWPPSRGLGFRAGRIFSWLSDKRRQLRSLAGNNDLVSALAGADDLPVEGIRFSIGKQLNLYRQDGRRHRLKICGARSGGFSNVYTVIDLDEMRPFCLKESRAVPGDETSKNEKLANEAEITLLLSPSPYLVNAIDAFEINSRLFLLLEYYPSTSLDLRLKRCGLSLESALTYAVHICRGMSHAQSLLPGFVHGDIKPANCLISSDGVLKLGDFGLASASCIGGLTAGKAVDDPGDPARCSDSGRGGTIAYMAPEQFGRDAFDRAAADVYSFGITLFEMICGARPFNHSKRSELVRSHLSEPPPLDRLAEREAPAALIALIERCLAKSPCDRPAGFHHIEAILQVIYQNQFHKGPLPELAANAENDDVRRKALAFLALGKSDRSVSILNGSIAAGEKTAELLAAKAVSLMESGRIDEAYASTTAALRIDANIFAVLFAHARVLVRKQKFEVAEEYLQRALELENDNCPALNLLGRIYKAMNEPGRARSSLGLSLQIDDQQPEPYEQLARIELFQRNFDNAAALAQRSVSIDPNRSDPHRILASAHLGQGNSVDAVKSLKSALRCGSNEKAVRREFVRACLSLHNGATMEGRLIRTLIQSSLILQRRQPEAAYCEKFVGSFRELLAESDFDPNILFFCDLGLSRAAGAVGQASAEGLYQTLIKLIASSRQEPLPPHCLYSLGRVFYYLDEIQDCKITFREILNRCGPEESAYYYLGACAEIEQEFKTALRFYTKANRLLDSEDSRTGIRRAEAKLQEHRKKRRSPAAH